MTDPYNHVLYVLIKVSNKREEKTKTSMTDPFIYQLRITRSSIIEYWSRLAFVLDVFDVKEMKIQKDNQVINRTKYTEYNGQKFGLVYDV